MGRGHGAAIMYDLDLLKDEKDIDVRIRDLK